MTSSTRSLIIGSLAGCALLGMVLSAGLVGKGSSIPGAPGVAWGPNVRSRVLLQQDIDALPTTDALNLRITELEMEPGTRIFEHSQIGPGAHVVVRGEITVEMAEGGRAERYQEGQAYFEGIGPLHQAVNQGPRTNRVLMFDMLPAARGFDGTQRFTARGRHNAGELRSGPYGQVPLSALPPGPLMLRVSELRFGPKAKTVEHTRLGPVVFFVAEGSAHIRKDWANSSLTHGTDGYAFETGSEAFILENKPAVPARYLSVEILPRSVGNGPSTVPTGRAERESSED